MASGETIIRAAGCPSAEINAGGTSTAEVQFSPSGKTTPLICYLPGSSRLNSVFVIRAVGRVVAGSATPNFTVSIYYGTSATIGNNTKIATTSTVAIATTKGNFMLTSECYWDSTSQRIQGRMSGFVYATAVAVAINTAAATGVDLTTEGLGLTITGTFSAGNAGNKAWVDDFYIQLA